MSHELPIDTNHYLIVTTARGVYAWSNRGIAELFASNSKGIATAQRISTDKNLLAVADSQVVILHDIDKGMQHTYRLRNKDQGQIRKLFYHPGKDRLFFTTIMQNAVQSFSLRNSELLDPAPPHPSPPIAFAVSPACDLMVSASEKPPVIYLSRIAYKQPPLLFVPSCSSAAVAVIAFHPSRSNVFALGFQDGTLAAYNATPLPTRNNNDERYSYAKIYGEISHIIHLHKTINRESTDSTTAAQPTISALQFLESYSCAVVSTGSDGYCYIVDFATILEGSSEVLRQWSIRAPATSMAALHLKKQVHSAQAGAMQIDGAVDEESSTILLAIGRSDGVVSVYNNEGKLLAARDFSTDGRILDLKWMQRSKTKPFIIAENKHSSLTPLDSSELRRPASAPILPARPPILRSSRSSTGSKIMVKLHTQNPPTDDHLLRRIDTIEDARESRENTPSLDGHAHSRPEISQFKDTEPERDYNQDPLSDSRPSISSTGGSSAMWTPVSQQRSRRASRATTDSRGSRKSGKSIRLPAIPPRPTPRPGGKLALRRIESAKSRKTSVTAEFPVPKEVVRAVTNGQPEFREIDLGQPQRPGMHTRYRSSKISPFTEVPEPRMTPNNPAQITPPHMVSSPLAHSQTAPVQYDRLLRTSWDAESSTSTGTAYVPSWRRPETPTKSKLNQETIVRFGSVSRNRPTKKQVPPAMPFYVSDSGTSGGSVLDWTHSQIQNPSHIPRAPVPSERGEIVVSKQLVTGPGNLPAPVSITPESNMSSSMDWNAGKRIIPVPRRSAAPASIPIQVPGPDPYVERDTTIPKLRKQETVINLKERDRGPAIFPPVETPKKPAVDEQKHIEQQDNTILPSNQIETTPAQHTVSPIAPNPTTELDNLPPLPSSTATAISSPLPFRPPGHIDSLSGGPYTRNSTIGSQSTYTIEDVIRVECAALARKIDLGFVEQRAWMQSFLNEQNWYAHRLEEENRKFREELARGRKN